MTVASTAMTAQRRRLAAQALIATRDRLNAEAAALLTPVVSVPALEATIAMQTPDTSAAITALTTQLQDLLASLSPVVAPVSVPVAAAPAKKAEPFKDLVIVGVNAIGVPLNAAGAFVSRKKAVDPKGLIAAWDAAQKAPQPAVAPPVPSVAPGLGINLAQLEQLLKALGGGTLPAAQAPQVAAAPASGLESLVRRDGQWFRCLQCEDGYWGTFRDEAFVLAKATKHVAAKHTA